MQGQEGCSKAGRESGSRLGNTTFGSGQFGGETAQEVILGLFGGKYRYRRQYAECVGRQEDYFLGRTGFGYGLYNIVDVVNRVRNTSIFGNTAVVKVDFAIGVNSDVLEQGIATNGVPDVGFLFLAQIDGFGVAAAFEVENTFVVPAVFVVADELTFGIGRKGGFAGTGQAEEDGGIAVFPYVGRAVHGSYPLQRQVVVHQGEYAFFHFSPVPCSADYLHFFGQVKNGESFGIQSQFFVLSAGAGFGSVKGYKIGFAVIFEFFFGGTDKHILYEVSLPGYFHDKTDFKTAGFVGAAESVYHIEFFVG